MSDYSDEEIDFSDLRDQYEVKLEEGLDAFVVCDGLPSVPEEKKPKLIKALMRKFNPYGRTREDAVFIPFKEDEGTQEDGSTTRMTEGFAFIEFDTAEQAVAIIRNLHGIRLDARHTLSFNKITDIERYGREGRISEEYQEPAVPAFEEKEHLNWWFGDSNGANARDQFVMFRGDHVGVFSNRKTQVPENIVDRLHWTDSFVQWTPLGTFLTSVHQPGVQLWAYKSWTSFARFAHPSVNLVDFSPTEKYLTTWSVRPITIDEKSPPMLTPKEHGANYIIWNLRTGKPIRSFKTIEASGPSVDESGQPVKKKIQWPAFKWSSDDQYVARLTPGESISVFELPSMRLLDGKKMEIEGIVDFEWAPALPQRDGIKTYEQLLCYWTPEIESNPAKVGLMSIPSKEIVRTRNLFNVSDAKLHWQSQAEYVCVKVDRHSKSKKSLATNLEIFRVKEKGVPVEVVDLIKDTVINFAWEPKGDRFVLITIAEAVVNTAVPPKTCVWFFCPEKMKGAGVGNFKLIRTIEKKNQNGIYWSPKGRFVISATVHSNQSYDLDFWDLDFEGEKPENDKDLTANLQLMATADHYGVTDVEWDPTGRYVTTSSSIWKHGMENGYHLYDFKGTQIREEHVDNLKQWLWRPRPPTLLSKEQQKQIRKNLREFSKVFDEEDQMELDSANFAVVETRRRQFREWMEWRSDEVEDLRAERRELGLPEDPNEVFDKEVGDGETDDAVIQEILEEVVEETEEIIS